jgi:alkylation response protein AidB-like acyl-CoA dehydrogenase
LDRYQTEIVKAASDFAKGEFRRELALELDKKSEFPSHIWKKAAELGFIGIHFDEEFSGGGLGLFENVLLAEAFCRHDSSIGAALMLAGFASECLLRFGSENLKRAYLPDVAEGRILCDGAFLEGPNDYGLKAQRTIAVKQDEQWVINGKKISVVNGKTAGFFIVFCDTYSGADENVTPSLFLVEKAMQGVVVHAADETLGLRLTSISDMEFRNVRVPANHMVGSSGQARRIMKVYWNECRILLAGMAIGLAQGAFDRARDYVKQRSQFGKKLALFQITRHKLARMAVKIEAARRLTYHAAMQQHAKNNNPSLGSMAKLSAARTAVEVSYEAIQLLGGYGYMTEYDVERYYRDAKTIEIFGGNTSHLLDDIGESVVGRVR